MIVPFPAAGPADVLARILSEPMRLSLGQPVVIENVSGAAGSIAVGRVARAAPDGYTLILGNLGTHVVNGAIYSLQYDLVKDFEPICLLPTNFQLLLAKSGLPAKDFKELIPWLKANAGKVTIGTAGPGAPSHLTAVYFQNALGTQFQLIPYRGTPQVLARPDRRADRSGVRPGVERAAAGARRQGQDLRRHGAASGWPRPPTFRPCMKADCRTSRPRTGSGCGRPRARPPTSSRGSTRRSSPPDRSRPCSKRLTDLGAVMPPPEQLKPEALGALQRSEIERWWPIIRAANIKGE